MAENENKDITLNGVLYAKHSRKWEKDGRSGEFCSYIVEIPTPKRWNDSEGKEKSVTKRNLVKFGLPKGMSPDDFEIGDQVTVRFQIDGREWDKKDGTGKDYGVELKATKVLFSDINRSRAKAKEEVFVVPSQRDENNSDDEMDLPF